MSYRYGRDWNVRLREPVDEIDEATARQRFVDGPQLSVSRMGERGAVPDYTLILGAGGGHVRVRVYDDNGSVVETFDWAAGDDQAADDQLFLSNYKVYVYPEGATRPQTFRNAVAHKAWVFWPDGTATCREVVEPVPEARVTEYRDLDVAGHWRARPAFGDWDRFGQHPAPRTPDAP